MGGLDRSRGLGPVEAGKPEVHQHDVGRQVSRAAAHTGVTVGNGADDLDVGLLREEQLEGRAVDVVVLDEEDANRVHGYSAESSSG